MIKAEKTASLLVTKELPVEEAAATELALEHSVLMQDCVIHVARPTGYVLSIGKRGDRKFYDLDKLKADNVYVHRRPFGGSGAMYGPDDVLFSVFVNKASFVDGFAVSAKSAYHYFSWQLCHAINEFGVHCNIDSSEMLRKEDGVCAHLQGRSEIITQSGSKMAVSVFKEDEVGFYMRGMLFVTDAWTKIYEYLVAPIEGHRINKDSIEMQLGVDGAAHGIMGQVLDQFASSFEYKEFITLSDMQREVVNGLKGQNRVI